MNACSMSGDRPAKTMFVDTGPSFRFALIRVIAAITVASLATAVSLGIAAYAGWLRGATPVQRTMIVALVCVAVLYVHLITMYWRAFSASGRIACGALWIVAVAAVMIGQMTFFIEAQRASGDHRVASVPVAELTRRVDMPRGRSLADIAEERVQLVVDLARVDAHSCTGRCPGIAVRKATLDAQLAVLDAETAEAKRRESEEDRLVAKAERDDALRASLRADPVASQIASWIGMTESRVELVQAAMFAVVLEGAAIMSWLLVVRVWPRTASGEPVAPGLASDATIIEPGESVSLVSNPLKIPIAAQAHAKTEDDHVLDEIRAEVVAGRLKPTQAAIRRFLECGQVTAAHFARLYRARFVGASA